MKVVFSRQIFEKYTNIKFRGILLVGTELLYAVGRKDRYYQVNGRFSQFC